MARLRQSLRTSLLALWCLWSQSIALTSESLTVSVAPAVPLTETMYKYDVIYDTGGKGDYDLRCSMVYLFRNDMGDSTTQLTERAPRRWPDDVHAAGMAKRVVDQQARYAQGEAHAQPFAPVADANVELARRVHPGFCGRGETLELVNNSQR
eukprot:TRINITY_DN1220_c0_g1_i6.p2 TRINITY_DN1220_c0_g1~~TRINITY_DN1220_c0_g1_i6.p2  ORF type:complete len:152 (-),score=5.11 TRINITY_DN1220_c0_g1_i6:202-657(-)